MTESLADAVQLDEIAEALPQRVAALSRLFLTASRVRASRTEIGVLHSLRTHPRRISELAAVERVTQPAITLLVNRLEQRGWVQRVADPSDRRAVLVSLTDAGRQTVAQLRSEYRALCHAPMLALDPEDVRTLAAAVGILDELLVAMREQTA